MPGSVAAWIQSSNASVITVGSPVANQSVSGTVDTRVIGSVATVIIGGSIAASFTPPANQSVSGTVNIGTIPGSVIAFPTGNQSVSGTVGVTQQSTWIASVFGNVSVLGTVPVTQATTPWVITGSVQASLTPAANQSVSGTVQTDVRASVAVVIIGGSIAASFTPPANQSVSGAVSVSNFPTNQNVSGSVIAFQGGTQVTSLVSTVPSSVLVGSSIFGQLPAGTAMLGSVVAYQGVVPWTIGSVYGNISGSVAATITNTNVNVSGSVVAFQGTAPWVIQSIVGTYSEDQASTSADKGILSFGVRNDTVASLVGSDGDYGAWSQDSAGRHLIKPFVSEDGTIISYTGSVVSGSVTLIQASTIGKRSYVTDYWVANSGATFQLVTFQDGSTSVLGYAPAPATGGSNSQGINIPLKTAPSQDLAFKTTGTSSVVYLTVKGYVAP